MMAPRQFMWPGWQMTLPRILFLIGVVLILAHPLPCRAAFFEDFPTITPKSTALCNAVTADPPGGMAVHFNPAGLCNVPEGKATIKSGALAAYPDITVKFTPDLKYDGLLGHFKPQDDPLANTESKVGGLSVAIPGITTTNGWTLDVPGLVFPMGNTWTYRRAGSRWAFGLKALHAYYNTGLYREEDDPGRFLAEKSVIQEMVWAMPGASYQVSDSLALGASVGVGSSIFMAQLPVRAMNDMTALSKVLGDATKKLEIPVVSQLTMPPPWMGGGIHPWYKSLYQSQLLRDDFTPVYHLGALWEPKPWFTLGVCYRSRIKLEYKGWMEFQYGEEMQRLFDWLGSSPLLLIVSGMFDLPYKARPVQRMAAYSNREFPQSLHVGVKLMPTKRLKLLCDAHWIQWSKWKDIYYTADQDIDAMKLTKMLGNAYPPNMVHLELGLEDTWYPSFGLEYQLNDRVALRLGYEFRKSSVPIEYIGIAPIPDIHNYGIGFEIRRPDGGQIDLAFAHYRGNLYIPNNTSHNMNSTSFTDLVTPYAGLNADLKFRLYAFNITYTIPFKLPF